MSAGVPHDTLTERLVPSLSIPPADCTNHCGNGPCDCSGKWRVQAYSAESVLAELARVSRELALANEEIRLREASQIPVIPRGAQDRMEALEREHETMRDALEALHAEVEMAEAAGICLPDRVPSLNAAQILTGSRAATPEAVCGSFGCVLPAGHNRGQADVPQNHLSATPEDGQ